MSAALQRKRLLIAHSRHPVSVSHHTVRRQRLKHAAAGEIRSSSAAAGSVRELRGGCREGAEPGVLPVWRPEGHAHRVAVCCGFESFECSAGGNNSDGVLGCGCFVGMVYGCLRHAGQAAVGPPVPSHVT